MTAPATPTWDICTCPAKGDVGPLLDLIIGLALRDLAPADRPPTATTTTK